MSKKTEYITVAHEGTAEIVEKKSRFIASVSPAASEAEALEFLARIRSQYPDARHNVYAYVIDENNIFRYSDDGEPSGTAGMPVLDTIRKPGITDTAVVVTRYFGGTLLGTGGLVRAYSLAARLGLENAGIVKRVLCDVLKIEASYDLSGKLQYMISSGGWLLADTGYGANVVFTVCTVTEETARFKKELADLTNGRVTAIHNGTQYVDFKESLT